MAMLGLYLFSELEHSPASRGLTLLLDLLREGKLRPAIEHEAAWTDIADIASRYSRRELRGKVVLHVGC